MQWWQLERRRLAILLLQAFLLSLLVSSSVAIKSSKAAFAPCCAFNENDQQQIRTTTTTRRRTAPRLLPEHRTTTRSSAAEHHRALSAAIFTRGASSLTASSSSSSSFQVLSEENRSSNNNRETIPAAAEAVQQFPHTNDPPHLALITMRCSCDSDAHAEAALRSLRQAVGGGGVDLVSVRVNVPPSSNNNSSNSIEKVEARLTRIVQQLVAWSSSNANPFRVVVSSDWIEAGLRAGAHGVHFKETHRGGIPAARALYRSLQHPGNDSAEMLVGTSTHTVESALDAVRRYQPDYFFAGTCFETESHPEKTGDDLEGPALPARVVEALKEEAIKQQQKRPKVLAIGGLNATNCREQVTTGFYVKNAQADGIATIRAVLQAERPDEAVNEILCQLRVQER